MSEDRNIFCCMLNMYEELNFHYLTDDFTFEINKQKK